MRGTLQLRAHSHYWSDIYILRYDMGYSSVTTADVSKRFAHGQFALTLEWTHAFHTHNAYTEQLTIRNYLCHKRVKIYKQL